MHYSVKTCSHYRVAPLLYLHNQHIVVINKTLNSAINRTLFINIHNNKSELEYNYSIFFQLKME